MPLKLRIRIRAFEPWYSNASNHVESVFGASKNQNPKILRIEFWTSHFDVKKLSKRPWDPHNRIRLEKRCPKVVSDRKIGWTDALKTMILAFSPDH